MDIAPRHQDPVAGDDELARVLAGVSNDPNEQAVTGPAGMQFEETPVPGATQTTEPTAPSLPSPSFVAPASPAPVPAPTTTASGMPSDLEQLKRNALGELRPLVGKLTLPPEEKFDTLLLIIRSTDDQSLLSAAYDAAKSIVDESKRAQALLDVIKEIDYFGSPPQQA